jgi:cell filamentation protein
MSRYDIADTYCYDDSSVLKNKLGLQDQDKLDTFEADITALRIIELDNNPVLGQFDLEHLQKIHFHVFQDLYDWAGKIRTVDIWKDESHFANIRMIDSAANKVFTDLAKENFFQDKDKKFVATRLAHYLSELNVLHPFRDGNGRTQRIFISQLAQRSRYQLNYADLDKRVIYTAMEKAFFGDESQLAELISINLKLSK